MTRKPNFWKCLLGVVLLALLVVGTWAATATSARLTSAKRTAKSSTTASAIAKSATLKPPVLSPAKGDDLISSVFEIDGNIIDPNTALPDDWETVNCGGGNADVETLAHDGTGTTIFTTGGSKDPSDLNQWKYKDGSVPDKDNIINGYAAKYTGSPNGDTIIAFGADRFDNSGDAFIGAWFFQKNVYTAPGGVFREQVGISPNPATDPLATHTVGDILILINFTGGGSTPSAGTVFEWVGTGGNVPQNPELNDITATAPVGSVLGISNNAATGNQLIPASCRTTWDFTDKSGDPNGTIAVAEFFEGAINLDAFPALRGLCINSFLVETRSSSSVTAQLKDFVLGGFNTCPEISVTKTADDTSVCEGTATTYTYTVDNPTGFTLTVSLVDDNETPGVPGDDLDVNSSCASLNGNPPTTFQLGPHSSATKTCTRTLGVGTHHNTVTATATLGSFSSTATDDETVTVTPTPAVTITSFVCNAPATSFTLSACVSGGTAPFTYSWSSGDTTSSITKSVGGTYSVTVTDANGCTAQATRLVGYCTNSGGPAACGP